MDSDSGGGSGEWHVLEMVGGVDDEEEEDDSEVKEKNCDSFVAVSSDPSVLSTILLVRTEGIPCVS